MTAALDALVAPDHPLRQLHFAGTSLIEASAGTGKTWTITGLYLRLLVESELEPRSILAVTFTNAATAELRDRIRGALARLIDRLRSDSATNDPLVECIAASVAHEVRDATLARLRVALDSFDEAVICTIHSFCQRALADWAFESRMPFEAELIANQDDLLAEIAQDFWRRRAPGFSPSFAAFVAARGYGPATLAGEPFARLVAPAAPAPIAPATPEIDDGAFESAYAAARATWLAERDQVMATLLAAKTWQANWLTSNAKHIDAYFHSRIAHLVMGEVTVDKALYPALYRFAADTIAVQPKPPKASHRFFDEAQALLELFERAKGAYPARIARLGLTFVDEARDRLEERKRATGQQSYDDLLARLAVALDGPAGDALAKRLSEQFHAALIDEFQDTDGAQYAIFRRVFADHGRPLVMVGDPKQAIYGFRGADVFTYLAAAGNAKPLTLDVNRRSTPSLVASVNALFTMPAAFVIDGIDFHAAQPLEPPRAKLILPEALGGANAAPTTIWWPAALPGDASKPISKSAFGPRAVAAVADEITRLLAAGARGEAAIEKGDARRSLVGSDIAVLVNTHREGSAMRAALAARGVGSVTYGQSSVYASDEAVEFARLLEAVGDPLNSGALRAALATRICGFDAVAIAQLSEAADAWDRMVETFTHYHAIAQRSGVMRLWRTLAADYALADRLAARADGPRVLTNYGHLAELLHAEGAVRGLDVTRLAVRLRAHAAAAVAGERSNSPDDPALLRLESDGELVRVLTIHTSKGLEFPIVFCPTLWNGGLGTSRGKGIPAHRFHDAARHPCIDFGGAEFDANGDRARYEQLGEALRLAYVALTRAELRLYVVWGQVNEAWASVLAWLIHRNDADRSDEAGGTAAALKALKGKLGGPPSATLREDLDRLAARANGAIAVRDLPTLQGALAAVPSVATSKNIDTASGVARTFKHAPLAARRIASFSGIVAAAPSETPDHDAFAADLSASEDANGEAAAIDPIFAFPRGAQAGSALHKIFEAIDFSNVRAAVLEQVAESTLTRFALPATWAPTAAQIVRHTLAAPLAADGLRLADVQPAARVVELEFAFPIERTDAAALGALLAKHRAATGLPVGVVGDLEAALAPGYLKGFVDLVFEANGRYYIADYKSNFLGATLAHYQRDRLAAAMAAEWYDLQYLLYCVALDRLLSWRLKGYDYERHFGGIYYLFLRGMRADAPPAQGVFFDRPARSTVQSLGRLLAGTRP